MLGAIAFLAALTGQAQQSLDNLQRDTEAYQRSVAAANSDQAKFCETYVGRTLAPLSFGAAAAKLPVFAPKGEYETTADFEARKAALKRPDPSLVVRVPVDRDYLQYDADAQELQIAALAFGKPGLEEPVHLSLIALFALEKAGLDTEGAWRSVSLLVSSTEKVTGSYRAQNSFGASFTVRQVKETFQAIFDHTLEVETLYRKEREVLFPVAEVEPHIVGTLPASPQLAKTLKNTLQLALLVEPKPPYLVRQMLESSLGPTFRDPREVTPEVDLIIADIKCGFAVTATGKVLGAYPTN